MIRLHDLSHAIPSLVGPPDALSESGGGPRIVDEFAADRGARLTGRNGKVFWFELVAWPKPNGNDAV